MGTQKGREGVSEKEVAVGMAVADMADVLRFSDGTLATLEYFRNVLGKASYPDIVVDAIKFTRGEIARSLKRLEEALEEALAGRREAA